MKKKHMIAIPADPNDPEDFDVTYEALERAELMRSVRILRHESGISQEEFARRYGFSVAVVRDWEQMRHQPSKAMMAYLRLIVEAPKLVAKIVATTVSDSAPTGEAPPLEMA